MDNKRVATEKKEAQKKEERKVIAAVISLLILWLCSIIVNLIMGYGTSFVTVIAPFQFTSGIIFALSWGFGVPTVVSAIIVFAVIAFVIWAFYRLVRRIIN